jgi:hypothetical protein
MKYEETAEKLAEYQSQIADIREKMRSAQASTEPEEIQDYEFATPQGKARLSALFGDKLFATCAHCTMWADGFNGVFELCAIAPILWWRRRTRPSDSRVSPPVAAGSFPWSRTKARHSRKIWAIARMAKRCRAFRSSTCDTIYMATELLREERSECRGEDNGEEGNGGHGIIFCPSGDAIAFGSSH